MAIPFLNNIDLSDNQLQNAKLHVTSTAPTAAPGQIYFDSTTNPGGLPPTYDLTAKYYSNGTDTWVSLKEYSFPTGTYVTGAATGTTPKPVITFDLNAVDGVAEETVEGNGIRYLSKNNKWAEIANIPGTYAWRIGVGAPSPFLPVSSGTDITITGAGTSVSSRAGDVITITSNDQFEGTVTSVATNHAGNAFTANIGNTSTINPSVDITMNGASTDYIDGEGNLTVFPAIPQGDITGIDPGTYISIDDPNTATPTVNALGTATPYISATDDSKLVARDANGYAYVKTPASGDNSTKVATTAFVQSATTGLLEFKGGFNADTGLIFPATPSPAPQDLYADIPLEVGDFYVVTTAGNFFSNANYPLTPGDSVIATVARAAGAAVVTDFAVVQSDTDLATNSTVGLMRINTTGGGGITSNIINGVATITNTDTNTSNTATGTITAGSLSGTVTHDFGLNTIVQTINAAGDTVFCDVTRTSPLGVGTPSTSVATIAVAEATDITILVQKIG